MNRSSRVTRRSAGPSQAPLPRALRVGAALLLAGALSGCVAAVGAGAAATAYTAYDRRSTGTVVDDQIIEIKAFNRLNEDGDLRDATNISTTSYNNVLLMTGQAPTEALKRRAEALVADIDKVRRVVNEIEVSGPTTLAARSGDSWTTSKVKARLYAEREVEGTRVKVTTSNGIVYLMGLMTADEAAQATEVVRRVGGVRRVVKLFEIIEGPPEA